MAAGSYSIRQIKVRPLELPLLRPIRTAVATMTSAPLVLIDVMCEDGLVGRSYLRTYTRLALGSLTRLTEDVAAEIVGRAGRAEEHLAAAQAAFRLLGDRGLVGMALAGLDMALWDLTAKRAQVPLARLLGGSAEGVSAYRPLSATEPEPACAEAEQALGDGFRAVKVKLGHGSLRDDVAVVSALRSTIGSSHKLMLDYNQSLSEAEALRRGCALDEFDVAWIEEPIAATNLLGYSRLVRNLSTPIAAGENLESDGEVEAALQLVAADVLTLDVTRSKGVTGWRFCAELAANAQVPVCSHSFPEFSTHLLAASPTGAWLEYHDYVAPILAQPLIPKEGQIRIGPQAGAGLVWDEAALARLR